jgi:ActR/RegA family two-component response regulator
VKGVIVPSMAKRMTPIGAMRVADPERWEKAVRDAMKEADGAIPEAAAALDVSRRTLHRWLSEPVFADVERRAPGRPWD